MTDETRKALVALLERAIPFLHDEGAKYEDDGSNEPLELAREIDAVLAAPAAGAAGQGEAAAWAVMREDGSLDLEGCDMGKPTFADHEALARDLPGAKFVPLYTTPPAASAVAVDEAARALVAKLKVIHDDPQYQNVWVTACNHGAPYNGPTYEKELAALTAALGSAGGVEGAIEDSREAGSAYASASALAQPRAERQEGSND